MLAAWSRGTHRRDDTSASDSPRPGPLEAGSGGCRLQHALFAGKVRSESTGMVTGDLSPDQDRVKVSSTFGAAGVCSAALPWATRLARPRTSAVARADP